MHSTALVRPLAFAGLLGQILGLAQPVERHLPAPPPAPTPTIAAPNAVPSEQDDSPIGPALRAIALLGPKEAVSSTLGDGVRIGALPRLDDAAGRTKVVSLLSSYLGRTLSRKLIAEVNSAVASYYRDLHYPFVSLSTPEQRIDNGALQVRVIEFTAGDVSLRGASEALRHRVNLQTGEAINSQALSEDLTWINRYPFRQVRAIFSPGQSVGTSDLALESVQVRPWQIYGGESNDGSPSTGFYRYFAGGSFGDLLGRDSVLSFRATVSPDNPATESYPRYRGAAVTYTVPAGRHGLLESSAQMVQTNQPVEPFTTGLIAYEGSIGYRFAFTALSKLVEGTDARIGLEANHQVSKLFFGDFEAYQASMNVFQLYIGLHHSGQDRAGSQTMDLSLHLSPGNLGIANGADQAATFSQGRLLTMRYGYWNGSYNRTTTLPAAWSLRTEVNGQLARAVLPRTAQMGFGSFYLVRGYTLDNGAYDAALISRNEVHAPLKLWRGAQIDPLLFFDAGYGRDNFRRQGSGLASVGAGANVRVARHFTFGVVAGTALVNSGNVRVGDVIVYQNITATF